MITIYANKFEYNSYMHALKSFINFLILGL